MKTISKVLAYAVCLQLTVGVYPIQKQLAYAQDDRTIATYEGVTDSESNASRSPAQEDNNLSMSAEEAVVNCKNYKEQFENQCTDSKGGVARDRAFIHDKEISGDEPRFYNCDAAAEVVEKVIAPFMDKIVAIAKESKESPGCVDCGVKGKTVADVIGTGLDPEAMEASTAPSCSLAEQKKFAKETESCSFACNIGLQYKGCPASSGVGAMCAVELMRGVGKAVWDILTFPFVLVKGVAQWSWEHTFGENETQTTNKALAMAGWTDKDAADAEKDPKKAEAGLLARAATFFNEFGKAIMGYPEYEMKGKCTDCKGQANLMCGVIGNTAGFIATTIDNGFIFGATKGIASNVASRFVKAAEGTGLKASIAKKTIKVAEKTLDVTKKSLKFVGTYTGVIPLGNLIIKNAPKVSSKSVEWWTAFKGSKMYASSKIKWVNKNIFSKNSIPGRITLKTGRTIAKGFKKMGEFEDKMFMRGVKFTNKTLHNKMLRAQTINALRVAKVENLRNEAKTMEVAVGKKDVVVLKSETGETTLNVKNWRGKTKDGWENFDGTKVTKVTSHQDGRYIFLESKDGTTTIYDTVFKRPIKTLKIAPEEAAAVAEELTVNADKLAASNGIGSLKVEDLDGIENSVKTEFKPHPNNKVKNTIVVDVDGKPIPVKLEKTPASQVAEVHTYQNGQKLIVKKKDGSVIIQDVKKGYPIAVAKTKEKGELISRVMAKDLAVDAEKTSAATDEALRGVNELVVTKDASDARLVQDWTDLKKAASNKLQGVKMKHLDDVENIRPVSFGSEAFNDGKKVENIVVAQTSQGPRQIKGVKLDDIKANGVHEYQDGKLLLVEKNDGSYLIHDVENGRHITQAPKGSEELEAILGRETKKYGGSLDEMSYEQVKTNLRINGTKYTEEVDAAGVKTLKIETPNDCTPKTLSFGVSKGI